MNKETAKPYLVRENSHFSQVLQFARRKGESFKAFARHLGIARGFRAEHLGYTG